MPCISGTPGASSSAVSYSQRFSRAALIAAGPDRDGETPEMAGMTRLTGIVSRRPSKSKTNFLLMRFIMWNGPVSGDCNGGRTSLELTKIRVEVFSAAGIYPEEIWPRGGLKKTNCLTHSAHSTRVSYPGMSCIKSEGPQTYEGQLTTA